MKRFLRAYLAVGLWMIVIFAASSDLGSSRNTSRFIGPILRWLNPQVTPEQIRTVQMFVRKGAHVAEYGVLALLLWRGRRIETPQNQPWNWVEFGGIVAFCALYAATDEFHQSFLPSRYGNPYDVMLDTFGAAAALLLLRALLAWRASAPFEHRAREGRAEA